MLNILITGAASGIGEATKDYFLNQGNKVFALDIKNIEEKENLKFFKVDITNESELKNIII